MEHKPASPSCPRCGAGCPASAARCRACGFTLIDDAERPRRAGSAVALVGFGAAVGGVVAVVAMLFTGGGSGSPVSPAQAGPPAPIPALEAERRLELRFGGESDDDSAAVRCPYRIEPRQLVRCELRYADGIARAMLVRLTPNGELDAAIPYPATLRR